MGMLIASDGFSCSHGVPALAPYFHFAFGWGIAIALQLVAFRDTVRFHEIT